MTATVSIQVRVPTDQARLIKRAARSQGKKVAAFVRDAAVAAAERFERVQVAEKPAA